MASERACSMESLSPRPRRETFYLLSGEDRVFAHFEHPRRAIQSGVGTASDAIEVEDGANRDVDRHADSGRANDVRGPWTGVVLMPLFGNDDLRIYRCRYEWAQRLAAQGLGVVRFDLPGYGNSSDLSEPVSLVDAWTNATACVLEWLRARQNCVRLVAIGMGLGGILACRAAASGVAIDDLVLWGAPAHGRKIIRELRALAALQSEGSKEGVRADGSLVAGGFRLSAKAIKELEEVDLVALGARLSNIGRALLLGRDGADAEKVLGVALEDAGVRLNTGSGRGYGVMLMEPQRAELPVQTIDFVSGWIGEESPRSSHSAGASLQPTTETVLRTAEYEEQPLWLDYGKGTRLFCVLTKPREPALLTAVLLNAGALPHIGPNRLWVTLARRWATAGIATVRVDLEGIGDADGDFAPLRSNEGLYRQSYLHQIVGLIDHCEGRGLPREVVLAGLCSGAYWALQGAVRDERVVGAYLINPRVLEYAPELLERRAARQLRKALRPATWGHLMTGRIHGRQISAALLATARMLMRRGATDARGRSRRDAIGAVAMLNSLSKRGVEVLGLFSSREPIYEELQSSGELAAINRLPHVRFNRLTPFVDSHMLESLALQEDALRQLDEALQRTLAGRGRQQPASAARRLRFQTPAQQRAS